MSFNNATLTVFKSQSDAETAVRQLQRGGFDLAKVSLVGRDAGSDAHVGGYMNSDGKGSAPENAGLLWGGIRGMLVGSAFFLVPGIGPLVVAGPLVTWIARSMATGDRPDKIGALTAALCRLGIPKESALRCESALRAGKAVLVTEGSILEMIHAREIFRRMPVEVLEQHRRLPAPGEQAQSDLGA